jgi:hypothetical protein
MAFADFSLARIYHENQNSDLSPNFQIRIRIDGNSVGVVWPFPVIFTGDFNPKLWSPIVAIGAFLTPPTSVDLTAFLALFINGKPHTFTLDMGETVGSFWLVRFASNSKDRSYPGLRLFRRACRQVFQRKNATAEREQPVTRSRIEVLSRQAIQATVAHRRSIRQVDKNHQPGWWGYCFGEEGSSSSGGGVQSN